MEGGREKEQREGKGKEKWRKEGRTGMISWVHVLKYFDTDKRRPVPSCPSHQFYFCLFSFANSRFSGGAGGVEEIYSVLWQRKIIAHRSRLRSRGNRKTKKGNTAGQITKNIKIQTEQQNLD